MKAYVIVMVDHLIPMKKLLSCVSCQKLRTHRMMRRI